MGKLVDVDFSRGVCVVCSSRAHASSTEEASLVIMRMLLTGYDVDRMLDELCSEHADRIGGE